MKYITILTILLIASSSLNTQARLKTLKRDIVNRLAHSKPRISGHYKNLIHAQLGGRQYSIPFTGNSQKLMSIKNAKTKVRWFPNKYYKNNNQYNMNFHPYAPMTLLFVCQSYIKISNLDWMSFANGNVIATVLYGSAGSRYNSDYVGVSFVTSEIGQIKNLYNVVRMRRCKKVLGIKVKCTHYNKYIKRGATLGEVVAVHSGLQHRAYNAAINTLNRSVPTMKSANPNIEETEEEISISSTLVEEVSNFKLKTDVENSPTGLLLKGVQEEDIPKALEILKTEFESIDFDKIINKYSKKRGSKNGAFHVDEEHLKLRIMKVPGEVELFDIFFKTE